MHQILITGALGCADGSLLHITNQTALMWGRDLIFYGICERVEFQLQSYDIREAKWQLFSHHHMDDPIAYPQTEIVSFKIGQTHQRKPATMLTEHFGLTWTYGRLVLVGNGVEIEL
jgi:hypothetical protein